MITDKALRGGIPLQGITEISGEAGSGKSQICLMLALQVRQLFYFFLILF
jgi:RecA/RadA recombinase